MPGTAAGGAGDGFSVGPSRRMNCPGAADAIGSNSAAAATHCRMFMLAASVKDCPMPADYHIGSDADRSVAAIECRRFVDS